MSTRPLMAAMLALYPWMVVAEEDIRDIRGPRVLAPSWLVPALVVGAAFLVTAVYGIWRWRRSRKVRVLSPFELALKRLEDLRSLMLPASAREFSTAVSDIVRSYIEQKFDVIATRRTTEEFLHDLLRTAALARHQELLADFLQQCDIVKFSAISLSIKNMEALRQSARTFVLATVKVDDALPTA